MEPFAPDWRTLGDGPHPLPGSATARREAAPRTIVITSRLIAWVVGALVAAAVTGGAAFLAVLPSTGGVVIEAGLTGLPATTASDTTSAVTVLGRVVPPVEDLVVDVEGAVAHPGLVHVPAGGRVGDALTKAGGFAAIADLTRTSHDLNLAQLVTDGLKVVVPAIGQGTQDAVAPRADAVGSSADAAAPAGLVDLNRAGEAELDTLPGVGPATIAKIVAARESSPFQDAEDLRTRGIVGEAAFGKLKGLVTVGR